MATLEAYLKCVVSEAGCLCKTDLAGSGGTKILPSYFWISRGFWCGIIGVTVLSSNACDGARRVSSGAFSQAKMIAGHASYGQRMRHNLRLLLLSHGPFIESIFDGGK